jgi:hypothetical protein
MHRGQKAGPAEPQGATTPTRPAAPAQLAQTSHQVSVNQRNTAANDPDRRNKVGSIQMMRLASLGSMDPQASE